MSDLYAVTVESRTERAVRLRVRIISRDALVFPVSASFALMLIEDGSAPGRARYGRWRDGVWAEDEWFEPGAHITRVELVGVRGFPPPPDARDPEELGDEWQLGDALYEITVDAPGMLDHFDQGQSWGTTAYDEVGEGPYYHGRPGDPTSWSRAT